GGTVDVCTPSGVDGFDDRLRTGTGRQHRYDNWLLELGDFNEPLLVGGNMSGDSFLQRAARRLDKIDRCELRRKIELLCARSARRVALLSQRQGGQRGLLGMLQFRHS